MRLFRVIVAGLLLAVLPVQGASALATGHCGSLQAEHRVGAIPDAAHSAALPAPDIGMAQHDAVSVGSLDTSQGAGEPAPPSQGEFDCPSCAASCCGVFLLNSAQPPVPLPVFTDGSISHPSVCYSDPTPERLERPPHIFLV